ncbi:MAG: hypothetical protein WBH85_14825 [Thermoanaerobaculia bacterium]
MSEATELGGEVALRESIENHPFRGDDEGRPGVAALSRLAWRVDEADRRRCALGSPEGLLEQLEGGADLLGLSFDVGPGEAAGVDLHATAVLLHSHHLEVGRGDEDEVLDGLRRPSDLGSIPALGRRRRLTEPDQRPSRWQVDKKIRLERLAEVSELRIPGRVPGELHPLRINRVVEKPALSLRGWRAELGEPRKTPSVFDLEPDLRVLDGRWQINVDELRCRLESGRLSGSRSDLEGPTAEGNPSHLEALVEAEGQDSRADSRECHPHLAPNLDASGGRIEDDLQAVDRRSIRVGGRRREKKRYRSEYASHYGARL